MNVTFKNICNVENLFNLIDSCIGPVYLQGEAERKKDLRQNKEIRKILVEACGKNEIEKLEVIISCQRDMPQVLNYLLGHKRQPAI